MPAHKKAKIMEEELVKGILFLVMAIFVFVLISKFANIAKPVPEWSRSVSAVEKAINNLDPKDTTIIRTANVQMKGSQYIQGFSKESGACPKSDDYPGCICACTSAGCKNIESSPVTYCKPVKYLPTADFIIAPSSGSPNTYTLAIELVSGVPRAKVAGISE